MLGQGTLSLGTILAGLLLVATSEAVGAPTVAIAFPRTSASFATGTPIWFSGAAYETSLGYLPSHALVWSSDRTDRLGSGNSIEVTTLPLGPHRVVLTASGPDGETDSAEVWISILDPVAPLPPVARVVLPPPQQSECRSR